MSIFSVCRDETSAAVVRANDCSAHCRDETSAAVVRANDCSAHNVFVAFCFFTFDLNAHSLPPAVEHLHTTVDGVVEHAKACSDCVLTIIMLPTCGLTATAHFLPLQWSTSTRRDRSGCSISRARTRVP
jgi:hypothetical protein